MQLIPTCFDCQCNLQAGAGLVADSAPEMEWEETVNKAAALGRAVDLAEKAFVGEGPDPGFPTEDAAERAPGNTKE